MTGAVTTHLFITCPVASATQKSAASVEKNVLPPMRSMAVTLESLSLSVSIQQRAMPLGSSREVCARISPYPGQHLIPCAPSSAGTAAGLDDAGVGTAEAPWAEPSVEDPRLVLCEEAEEDMLTGTCIACWGASATCCLMSFAGPLMGTRGRP